jgi:hypothetical protein
VRVLTNPVLIDEEDGIIVLPSCGQRGAFTGSPCRLCKLGARSHELDEIDLRHLCTGPLARQAFEMRDAVTQFCDAIGHGDDIAAHEPAP